MTATEPSTAPAPTERSLSYVMAFNEAVRQSMRADENVFCAGEDIGAFGGVFGTYGGLQKEFGEQDRKSTRLNSSHRH